MSSFAQQVAKPNTSSFDRTLRPLSIVAVVVSLLTWMVCLVAETPSVVPLSMVLAAYCLAWFMRARNLADPLLIFALVLLQYSLLPNFADPSTDRFLSRFGVEGAQNIHSAAIVAFFVSHAVVVLMFPLTSQRVNAASKSHDDNLFKMAAIIGGGSSVILSLMSIVQRGSVALGDVEYGAAFAVRLDPGNGFFLLAFPLAVAGFSFAAVSKSRPATWSFAVPAAAFVMLFLASGQRKYFLIPAMIFVGGYVRRANLRATAVLMLTAVIFYIAFVYLGFLRINQIDWSEAFDARVLDNFALNFGSLFAGETPPLFATASAAYSQSIAPLPNLGDYALAWTMAVPQFLNIGTPFTVANVRFSVMLDPAAAARGLGWGFSYWAEAYMVGGYLAVGLMCGAIVMLFRWIYVRAGGDALLGVPGVISVSSLYYALWAQRNAFGYTLKEFIVYQLLTVLVLVGLCSTLLRFLPKRPTTIRR